MRIFVTGTRGIPDIPGGVEKHCQQLYPLLAARGHEVTVSTRSCYVEDPDPEWRGIRLVSVFAPRRKSLEAIVHTFASLIVARRYRPDVVHIHAIGPALLTPLARAMGFRVVVTNHGPDYDRQKWGPMAKFVLRAGERLGNRFANEVIAISKVIADGIRQKDGREANIIHNGVELPERNIGDSFLRKLGIKPAGKYILAVARLVPEKGLHDLLTAFAALPQDPSCHLVIAGDADHETPYSQELKQIAGKNRRVVMTGYITGDALAQVFSHASLFALPSYHEGLPIALLEAMSFGLPVLVSDIPAHREVGLPEERYFRCGDVADLQQKLTHHLGKETTTDELEGVRELLKEKYDWKKIAGQTLDVYKKAAAR